MQRSYFVQWSFYLPGSQTEDVIYDESMRRFASGAGRRGGAGLGYDSALSPFAGAASTDPGYLQFDHRVAGRTVAVAALGDHRGLDHHPGAQFDEEREREPRP